MDVIQAFESFVLRCPKEIGPHLDSIVNISLKFIKYDPNYADDGEDEDDKMEEDEEEQDEYSDDGDYSGDDDSSWKVRACIHVWWMGICIYMGGLWHICVKSKRMKTSRMSTVMMEITVETMIPAGRCVCMHACIHVRCMVFVYMGGLWHMCVVYGIHVWFMVCVCVCVCVCVVCVCVVHHVCLDTFFFFSNM